MNYGNNKNPQFRPFFHLYTSYLLHLPADNSSFFRRFV